MDLCGELLTQHTRRILVVLGRDSEREDKGEDHGKSAHDGSDRSSCRRVNRIDNPHGQHEGKISDLIEFTAASRVHLQDLESMGAYQRLLRLAIKSENVNPRVVS